MEKWHIVGMVVFLLLLVSFYFLGYASGIKEGYRKGVNETLSNFTFSRDVLKLTCSLYPEERAICCSPVQLAGGVMWAYKPPSGANATYLCEYNLTSMRFINCTELGFVPE